MLTKKQALYLKRRAADAMSAKLYSGNAIGLDRSDVPRRLADSRDTERALTEAIDLFTEDEVTA